MTATNTRKTRRSSKNVEVTAPFAVNAIAPVAIEGVTVFHPMPITAAADVGVLAPVTTLHTTQWDTRPSTAEELAAELMQWAQPVLETTPKATVKRSRTQRQPLRSMGGLKGGQVRILEVLVEADEALPRARISELGNITTSIQDWLGPVDESKIDETASRYGFMSLLGLGYVASSNSELGKVYSITEAGRKALTAIKS